jgi:hypothetical protein
MTKKLAQFGVLDVSGIVLSNGLSENKNLFAQTFEFETGEISGNFANCSLVKKSWKLEPVQV